MAKASQEENAIDLEATIQEELGKLPSGAVDGWCVAMPPEDGLKGPYSGQRCGSSDRELLQNNFLTDDPLLK